MVSELFPIIQGHIYKSCFWKRCGIIDLTGQCVVLLKIEPTDTLCNMSMELFTGIPDEQVNYTTWFPEAALIVVALNWPAFTVKEISLLDSESKTV